VRTAVDSNVFSALWSGEPTASQMQHLLRQSHQAGAVVICGAVYAELLAHPKATQAFVDEFLNDTSVVVDFALEEAVWRKAGQAYAAYAKRRRKDGSQTKRLLVDFVVGAHASLQADRLLTLDTSRYSQDFAELILL
jgi:predicted nucleic acid-binding protein